MSGIVYQVPPMSRKQIRGIAANIRKINKELTGQDDPYFPIVEFLDVTLPRHYEDFSLEILEPVFMGDAHGLTYPDEDRIQIRLDVYQRAHQGQGRDRMTMAHELGHLVLHTGLGLARMAPSGDIKPYHSSEWQASALAGELLVSYEHIGNCCSALEAAMKFGVTTEAANLQWSVFRKEWLVR
jgi:hypothetical protein